MSLFAFPRARPFLLCLGLTLGLGASLVVNHYALADEPSSKSEDSIDEAGLKFFESKIRPVLVQHCYECHASDAQESGLRVDSRQALEIGGSRGSAISLEKPRSSLLLSVMKHQDPELSMPPNENRLSDEVIDDFERWIEMGAPDPRRSEGKFTRDPANRDHWAYQPLARSSAPYEESEDLSRAVDRYLRFELERNELSPSVEAEPTTLIRRVFFDLIGLPPSPAQTQAFVEQQKSEGIETALREVVDLLLDSPQFGERWGRHWLDVARFGESSGGESNVSFPYAWRYRDYVIDAFNEDVPYDRFLAEQIAGDLLEFKGEAERARLLVATGFLAVGPKNLGENNDEQFQADLVDEQIDALTRSVLGSSVACARCHDHKFDMFTMQDYYGLAGIFASTKTYFGTFPSPANNRGGDPLVLPSVEGQVILNKSLSSEKFEALKRRFSELDAERTEIQAANRARWAGEKPKRQFTLREVLANIWRLGAVEGKLATLDAAGKALPVAMGVREAETIVDSHLLKRGEIQRKGGFVPRALPGLETGEPIPLHQKSKSGRLELADWLTDEVQALTSRVYVNRVWQHVFGEGLVRSVDNFGTTGAVPSHPELLDKIATEFISSGWSTKDLIRKLVLTEAYRQASDFREQAFQVDPENRLLWRMPKRRLEAEAIRDAMLSVSGELDDERPDGSWVGSLIGDRPIALIGLNKKLPQDLDGVLYRSVYLPVIRDRLPDALDLFDGAEPSLVTGKRETTNVPTQALYLLNSAFVRERAAALAKRLLADSIEPSRVVEQAYQICFGREPSQQESQLALSFLTHSAADGVESWQEVLPRFTQVLLLTAEFRTLD